MLPGDPAAEGIAPPAGSDADSVTWVRSLTGSGEQREAALARLHEMLLRIARSELRRRGGQLRITGPELDDLAYQAAADALLAITAKIDQFRGESRFTTWAYKFVIFEVSAKVGRHFWANPPVPMDAEDRDRLPDRLGLDPAREAERRELASAVRRADFEALMNGWSGLDRFLQTDPRDVGCAEAMDLLHVYAELVIADASAAERYPGIAAHLRACGPCGEDFDGLLAALRGSAD